MDEIKRTPIKSFSRGEVLIQKGAPSHTFKAIRTGFVKVNSINDDGFERLVWIAGRYDIVPTERLFLKSGSVRFFYTALTDGTYYEVNKADFLRKAQQDPELMLEITKGMSNHYDNLLQHIDAINLPNVKERLQRTLLYLAEQLSADTSVDLYEYGLVLTHADFANLIGSTRETTSVILNHLRREKYIHYSRSSFVVEAQKLRALIQR